MNDFNAKKAREIVAKCSNIELEDILSQIELSAYSGKNSITIRNKISIDAETNLREKGFRVDLYTSTQTEAHGDYYVISW